VDGSRAAFNLKDADLPSAAAANGQQAVLATTHKKVGFKAEERRVSRVQGRREAAAHGNRRPIGGAQPRSGEHRTGYASA